jgi:DNA-directed RNA polymerase subunit RPC12/RpoP
MTEQRSDVYCTNCGGQFIATLDLSLNGNHEITCPLCGHVHYRVVRDGVVTEDRWASSQPVYMVVVSKTISVASTTNSTATLTLSSSWLNRSDLNLVW